MWVQPSFKASRSHLQGRHHPVRDYGPSAAGWLAGILILLRRPVLLQNLDHSPEWPEETLREGALKSRSRGNEEKPDQTERKEEECDREHTSLIQQLYSRLLPQYLQSVSPPQPHQSQEGCFHVVFLTPAWSVNIVQEAHDITDLKTDIWDVEKHDLLHGHEPSSKQVKKSPPGTCVKVSGYGWDR